MNWYINSIEVRQIFHLKNFTIHTSEKAPHLILTGKNGSGKTILLRAIADYLNNIKVDQSLNFLYYEKNLNVWESKFANAASEADKHKAEHQINFINKEQNRVFGKVKLEIPTIFEISKQYDEGDFILAFYGAMRDTKMQEPKNPTKPHIDKNPAIDHSSTDQFLNFLSDLKIQEALARNENQAPDADNIKEWFISFEKLLGELYEDPDLHLEFNYKDYTFRIKTAGKSFKFTELSDGFTAAIDIIADLILKMQQNGTVTRAYNISGIVLIDEIETHLHLSLQGNILKILTRIFPNIQFIVTTHSPFVLNSLDNATAFDLEHLGTITDLSEYSYESLAEGYFGVPTESSYIGEKLKLLKDLLSKESLSANDEKRKQNLINDFNHISELISPQYVGEFRQLMIKEKSKKNFQNLIIDWNNILISCNYCNKKKLDNYDDIINPLNEEVENLIKQELDFSHKKAIFTKMTTEESIEKTISLLNMIYNGKICGLRRIKEERFFEHILSTINDFNKLILDFLTDPSELNKNAVKEELSISKEALGFKYWIILSNPLLWKSFANDIVWNK